MSNPTELPDLDKLSAEALECLHTLQYLLSEPEKQLVLAELARRAQPEGEAPQADWQAYALNLRTVLERGYKSLASAAMCQTRDGEAAWHAMGEALKASIPAATLSPLCGAQHAESGKEVEKELRNQMAFIAAYDPNELDGGDSQEGMRAADRLACIIRRARKTLDVCDALAAQQAAAPACSSAPGTPEAPKKPAHGHRDDYYLLANGRRLGLEPISRVRSMPNWVLAMELFATGSTSAHQLCRDAGVDPDSTTTQRAAQLDGGQEGSGSHG